MPAPTEKPTAEELAKKPPEEPTEQEVAFTVADLKERAEEHFAAQGYTVADVAGAFYGVDDDTEVTTKEARARIAAWKKAPVETDPAHQEG